jgi:hypothetical protein
MTEHHRQESRTAMMRLAEVGLLYSFRVLEFY